MSSWLSVKTLTTNTDPPITNFIHMLSKTSNRYLLYLTKIIMSKCLRNEIPEKKLSNSQCPGVVSSYYLRVWGMTRVLHDGVESGGKVVSLTPWGAGASVPSPWGGRNIGRQ